MFIFVLLFKTHSSGVYMECFKMKFLVMLFHWDLGNKSCQSWSYLCCSTMISYSSQRIFREEMFKKATETQPGSYNWEQAPGQFELWKLILMLAPFEKEKFNFTFKCRVKNILLYPYKLNVPNLETLGPLC